MLLVLSGLGEKLNYSESTWPILGVVKSCFRLVSYDLALVGRAGSLLYNGGLTYVGKLSV